jgi:hypothetical protein
VLRLPWQADRRQLRVFALGLALLLALLAARRWHHAPGLGAWLLGAAALAVLAPALADPSRIRGLYLLWLVAIAPLAWAVSYLLLGILYFLVITPIGLARRLLGRDALALRRRPAPGTLWHPRPRPQGFESYRRQA